MAYLIKKNINKCVDQLELCVVMWDNNIFHLSPFTLLFNKFFINFNVHALHILMCNTFRNVSK